MNTDKERSSRKGGWNDQPVVPIVSEKTDDDMLGLNRRIDALFLLKGMFSYCHGDSRKNEDTNQNVVAEKVESEDCCQISIHSCKICSYQWVTTNKRIKKDKNESDIMPAEPKLCPQCRSSLWNNDNVTKCKCKRCGHEWVSSTNNPPMCPSCRTSRWNTTVEFCTCNLCGNIWEKKSKADPKMCPSCKSYYWNDMAIQHICKVCGTKYILKNNVCSKCPACGDRYYYCVCMQCGHIWGLSSNTRPKVCESCGSSEWGGNKKHVRRKRVALDTERISISGVSDSEKIDKIPHITGMDRRSAEIFILLREGKRPVEVSLITGESFDSVMSIATDAQCISAYETGGQN